jgi:hypothetical protein
MALAPEEAGVVRRNIPQRQQREATLGRLIESLYGRIDVLEREVVRLQAALRSQHQTRTPWWTHEDVQNDQ